MKKIPDVGTTVHFKLANGHCRPAVVTDNEDNSQPGLVVTLNGPTETDAGVIVSADRLHAWVPAAEHGQDVFTWHDIHECTPHSPEDDSVAAVTETPAAPQIEGGEFNPASE